MRKQSAIVVFPGRGTYGKSELGYQSRYHADKSEFFRDIDQWRALHNRAKVSDLDSAPTYSASQHASSKNASAIIYACALADFMSIDQNRYEIVGVCGNSLGWYLTLAAGGALSPSNAIRLIDAMGVLMEEHGVGGQLVYPFVDENWKWNDQNERSIGNAIHAGRTAGQAYISIRLGGTAVLAGDEAGLTAMEKTLPNTQEKYPFRLARHSAFHTPLLKHVSDIAVENLQKDLFSKPHYPMIDGRGVVWTPGNTCIDELFEYTLRHQILEPYDFSKSVEVSVKEFAPDRIILVGPGATLGAPIAQELIRHRWKGLNSKSDFLAAQMEAPYLLAMGRDDQRKLVV